MSATFACKDIFFLPVKITLIRLIYAYDYNTLNDHVIVQSKI